MRGYRHSWPRRRDGNRTEHTGTRVGTGVPVRDGAADATREQHVNWVAQLKTSSLTLPASATACGTLALDGLQH